MGLPIHAEFLPDVILERATRLRAVQCLGCCFLVAENMPAPTGTITFLFSDIEVAGASGNKPKRAELKHVLETTLLLTLTGTVAPARRGRRSRVPRNRWAIIPTASGRHASSLPKFLPSLP
jgi:hypothetical protein